MSTNPSGAGPHILTTGMCAIALMLLADAATEARSPGVGEVFRDPFASGSGQGPEMVLLPPGRFTMGSTDFEELMDNDEGPMRTVEIGYSLAVGRYEVSVDEFNAFAEETGWSPDRDCVIWFSGRWRAMPEASWRSPGFEQSGSHPVTCVSWHDAQAYLEWLNLKTGLTGRADSYRLPSEAEWEYAARAGADTDYSFGDDESQLGDHAWFSANTNRGAQPVGARLPNAFGLHDMHGNVWEWVEDCYSETYEDAPSDGAPRRADDCPGHSSRGGGWDSPARYLRSAQRSEDMPNSRMHVSGFRVARTLPE